MIYYSRLTLLLLLVSASLVYAMEHDEKNVVPALNSLLGIPAEVRLIIFDKTLQQEFKAQPHILAFFKRLCELRTVHTTFRTQMLEEDKESQSQKFIEASGQQNEPYAQCLKTILSARRNLTPFERLVLSYFSSSTPEIGDIGALMHLALEEADLDIVSAVAPTITPSIYLTPGDERFIEAAARADKKTKELIQTLRSSTKKRLNYAPLLILNEFFFNHKELILDGAKLFVFFSN